MLSWWLYGVEKQAKEFLDIVRDWRRKKSTNARIHYNLNRPHTDQQAPIDANGRLHEKGSASCFGQMPRKLMKGQYFLIHLKGDYYKGHINISDLWAILRHVIVKLSGLVYFL